MKKFGKILTVLAAGAIVTASAIPSFAGSDGWTNCVLHSWRDPSTLAVAPVSGTATSSISTAAQLNVSSLTGTDRAYFDIYELDNGHKVSSTVKHGTGPFAILYNYPCVKKLKLHLKGGNDWYVGHECTTSGTCNFG